MNRLVSTLLFALASSAAAAQTPTTAMASGICGKITDQLESIQMDLAMNGADAITDNSAPRATMRAAEDTASLTRVLVLFRQLETAHCSPYPYVLGRARYMTSAMDCLLAKTKFKTGDTLNECKRSDWKPAG